MMTAVASKAQIKRLNSLFFICDFTEIFLNGVKLPAPQSYATELTTWNYENKMSVRVPRRYRVEDIKIIDFVC
jgi:hypothetical protein